MEKKEFYSASEVAKMKGFSRQEIIRKIWRGIINARKIGNQYVISHSEVERIEPKV